jgi:hypothetical protein
VNAGAAARRGENEEWIQFQPIESEEMMNHWAVENNFSRYKVNHNVGSRVIYFKCRHNGCPMRHRCVRTFSPTLFFLEHIVGVDHNHNNLAPLKGLSKGQKNVIDVCIARGDSAPKKVRNFCIIP